MIYLIDDNSTEFTLTLLGLCWSTEPAQDTLHENNIVYSGGEDIPILITKDEQGEDLFVLGYVDANKVVFPKKDGKFEKFIYVKDLPNLMKSLFNAAIAKI